VPQADIIDSFLGNATFVGQSGADTFIMNGALIARGTTGENGGGSGNTYIIPGSGSPASTVATDGWSISGMGSGTIEGKGSGNVVMVGGQQLTTLIIMQYEDQSATDFFTNAPIAQGQTNTGQSFLLIQDDPGSAGGENVDDNPHNGERIDFELYIFSGGMGPSFNHVDDSFGPNSAPTDQDIPQEGDSGILYQRYLEQAATAHITFAGGYWSDYGITVEDDTAANEVDGVYDELIVNPVPGNFLIGPGDGPPIPGATDQVGEDDEEDDDSDITVSAGTTLTVSAGSAVNTVTVSAGGYVVGGGSLLGASGDAGVISGVAVGQAGSAGSSGYVEVSAGGSALAVTVVNGAVTIDSGGYASGVVLSGASATLAVAGVAVGTVVGSGSFDLVEYGGVASGSIISNGGVEYVSSGGAVVSAAVAAGGTEVLSSGATATGVTVASGGTLGVSLTVTVSTTISAAITSTTTISGVTVASGGVIDYDAVTVSSGGALILLLSSVVSDVTVLAGGKVFGAGAIVGGGQIAGQISGTYQRATSAASGTLEVQSGGRASGVIAIAVPIQIVSGVAVGTVVDSSAIDSVCAGGSASASVISKGGIEDAIGGLVSGAQVLSGGLEILNPGATASAVMVSSGGAVQFETIVTGTLNIGNAAVTSVTTSSGVTVASGGLIEYLYVIISSGGVVDLSAGAAIYDGGLVNSGAVLSGAGTLSSGSIYDQGVTFAAPANLFVSSGGVISNISDSGSIGLDGGLSIDAILTGSSASMTVLSTVVLGAPGSTPPSPPSSPPDDCRENQPSKPSKTSSDPRSTYQLPERGVSSYKTASPRFTIQQPPEIYADVEAPYHARMVCAPADHDWFKAMLETSRKVTAGDGVGNSCRQKWRPAIDSAGFAASRPCRVDASGQRRVRCQDRSELPRSVAN
jgi:autotransporter passenger strand-loop-strand repeat protein